MKIHRKQNNVSTRPLLSHFVMLLGATLIITMLISYGVWSLMVAPAHLQRFEQHSQLQLEKFQQNIQQHIALLQQPLPKLIKDIDPSIFDEETSQFFSWLNTFQERWLPQVPYAQSIDVLSRKAVQQQEGTRSFIVLHMMNRLEAGESMFLEAAKQANGQWLLHKVEPVMDRNEMLVGVVHLTFSLEGLRTLFDAEKESIATVALRQHIDNPLPLVFLFLEQESNQYLKKVVNIPNSYWQMSYQPSKALKARYDVVPLWFWSVVLGLLLIGGLLSYLYTRPEIIPEESLTRPKKNGWTKDDSKMTGNSEMVDVVEQSSLPPTDSELLHDAFPHHVFRAYDIRGLAHSELDEALFYKIGQAVATKVLDAGDGAIVVGYDARTHSPLFSQAVAEGIISTGCDVINIGLVPTPLMNFSACQHKKTNSGLIVTASHNPAEYNGCKMVVNGETLVDDDIQHLKSTIAQGSFPVAEQKGTITLGDFSQVYIDKITTDVAVMDGWNIVIDAANGASSELAPRLFQSLGCQVSPLFCEFDGTFPNHDPDPSVLDNLSELIGKVKDEKADIGFAFDGDGDRLMVVTQQGRVMWPDQLLMLFAQDIVARHPGSDVIFDVKSTHLLAKVISAHGGRPIMWKTGHSHIKSKMKETQSLLGGEFSGHIFFKERWFGFDDGLYAAARLLEILTLTGRTIDDLLDELPSMVSTPEIKVAVSEARKFKVIDELTQTASFKYGKITTIDGLRVDFDRGWGLVRASNTAPVLTLRFEAEDKKELAHIKKAFQDALKKVDPSLDTHF